MRAALPCDRSSVRAVHYPTSSWGHLKLYAIAPPERALEDSTAATCEVIDDVHYFHGGRIEKPDFISQIRKAGVINSSLLVAYKTSIRRASRSCPILQHSARLCRFISNLPTRTK